MSCDTCIRNGCRGLSFKHYEGGCTICECKVPHAALTGNVPAMRAFDQPSFTIQIRAVERFFERHKRFARHFSQFGVAWFLLSNAFLAYAAGLIANQPNAPLWLPYFLLFYSIWFGYEAYKASTGMFRKEVNQKISSLEQRIKELEDKK